MIARARATSSAEAADAASDALATALLNCFMRESERWRMDDGRVVIELDAIAGRIVAGLRHRSLAYHHRFDLPARLETAAGARDLDLPLLACLLLEALDETDDGSATLARLIESRTAIAEAIELRSADLERLFSGGELSFGEAEQSLILGHAVHPTPKSLSEMGVDDRRRYAPEQARPFALHWLAVRPEWVVHDSALATSAPELARRLLRDDPQVDHGALDAALRPLGERVLIPAHPWEATHLAGADESAALFADETIVDLGPLGSPVAATSSVRTVHRDDWPWQLKLCLHVRVTNSMRMTLPKELRRALEAARLWQTAAGELAAQAAPRLTVLHDPAYLAVERDGEAIDGLSVLLRENRWPAGCGIDVTSLAALCQDHPLGGRSRLAAIVTRLASAGGEPTSVVAREWFRRYCEVVVASLLRLYLDAGLCFEPHQQNTLVELDGGMPDRCVIRDSQGYFHREAAHADMTALIPGIGEASESIFPEALADQRLVYYPFVNAALGVVDALGAGGCADENVLLSDLRATIERERAAGGRYPATLLDRLLDDDRWPCKANLRTRMNGMDELVGDISEQSVYVTVPNPLRERISLRPLDLERDLDLVGGWMDEPHVAAWWQLSGPRARVRAYLADQVKLGHSESWIASVDGRPFAYVETYRAVEDPLAAHYDAWPGDRGWHVLVGPADLLGTGVPRDLGRLVVDRLLAEPGAERVVCEPDVRNERMVAFCQRLGARREAVLDLPDKRAALMVWERDQ